MEQQAGAALGGAIFGHFGDRVGRKEMLIYSLLNLSGYAHNEDIDFSYRLVKRGYVLLQTPKAPIDHLKAQSDRLSSFEFGRMHVANQFYLHRKNMPQTPKYKAALWWALLGLVLLFVTFEVLFFGLIAIMASWLLDSLKWWTILVANLIADIAYLMLDPRTRKEG